MKRDSKIFSVLLIACVVLTSVVLILDIQDSYVTQKKIAKLEKTSKYIKETQFVEIVQQDGYSFLVNINNHDVYVKYNINNGLWGIRPLYDENNVPMKESELRNVDAMEYDINNKATTKEQIKQIKKLAKKYKATIPKDQFAQ